MAGPRPDDPYNPVPQVSPNTQAPNDYLQVRADPGAFGGQIGEAQQELGKSIQGVGDKISNYVLQSQGLANEHEAAMAELQLATDNGSTYDKYKGLTGLDASNAKDQYVQEVLNNNAKIRAGISNPAAQRAYDLAASRRLSFTITDMNSYAADQRRSAYKQGRLDSIKNSEDSMLKLDAAADPSQFAFAMATFTNDINALYTAPDYGKYQNIKATVNPDHTLNFGDSPEGKIAQADYDNFYSMEKGKIWSNRITAVADSTDPGKGGVERAIDMLHQNKDQIPGLAYNTLERQLHGPWEALQGKNTGDEILSKANGDWQASASQPSSQPADEVHAADTITKLFPGSVITSQQRSPEHNAAVGGVPDSAHLPGKAIDFVPPKGVTLEQVTEKLKSEGIEVTTALDEKNHFHISWQPKEDQKNNTPYADSQATYLSSHTGDYVQAARDAAKAKGFGLSVQDQAAAYTERRINEIVLGQERQIRSDRLTIYDAINKGSITSPSQLESSNDPAVKAAWRNIDANDPYASSGIRNKLLVAASKGASQTNGTQFYDKIIGVLDGSINDPAQLQDYVQPEAGKDSPLTMKGFGTLTSEMKAVQGNYPFAQAEANFLKQAKAKITGNFNNSEVNKAFDNFLMQAIPLIQSERTAGKNVAEIFGPKSPLETIRDSSLTQANKLASVMSPGVDLSGSNKTGHLDDIKDGASGIAELQHRVKTGRATVQQATDYALKRGWVRPTPPKVPAPQ